ncbi:MAG: AbrB/MazE/SpoVT family DNA-binding domain-containing protein [Desulfovibrio sp.]|nr:AbrB/MazE/SpoVT family DNA-binding domain-containing protein [Desulfovibrio sp.]
METRISAIGNSKGVRIPKPFLEECGIQDFVKLTITKDGLLVSPVNRPRQGWEEALIANPPDDNMQEFSEFDSITHSFDDSEWTWPQKP